MLTDQGPIACEIVVNCAGIWAKQVGALAGVPIAAAAVEHQYMVTEKTLDLPHGLPTLRDPDHNFYLKPDVGAFAVGGWEQGTKPCWRCGVPDDFSRTLFPSNFARFEAIVLPAAARLPVLNEVGIQTLINGPIPVSADGEPIMGLAPGFENFYLACGFTAGIAASGGAGKAMANWILEGDPGMDLWAFDVRRFGPHHANRRFLEARAVEAYGRYYAIHWPGEESVSGRGQRTSPLHDRLAAAGAVFGSKFGWERPKWFATPGAAPEIAYSFEDRPSWFDAVGAECRAVRERVALIDQTSFAKFRVSGPGALAYLQHLAANDIGRGGCVYTQLCNGRGGIEADLTVMALEDGSFYMVTGSGFGVRDANWMRRYLPSDGSVTLDEVTSAYAVINLCGPRAREVLEAVTRRRPLRQRLSLPGGPRDRAGTCHGLRAARSAMWASWAGSFMFPWTTPSPSTKPSGRRARPRASPTPAIRAIESLAPGEGLPLLERRPQSRGDAATRPAWFLRRLRQGGLPRPRGAPGRDPAWGRRHEEALRFSHRGLRAALRRRGHPARR